MSTLVKINVKNIFDISNTFYGASKRIFLLFNFIFKFEKCHYGNESEEK